MFCPVCTNYDKECRVTDKTEKFACLYVIVMNKNDNDDDDDDDDDDDL